MGRRKLKLCLYLSAENQFSKSNAFVRRNGRLCNRQQSGRDQAQNLWREREYSEVNVVLYHNMQHKLANVFGNTFIRIDKYNLASIENCKY